MDTGNIPANRVRHLPPLILHPFSDAAGPNKLVESSRASLMLQGLIPSGDSDPTDLERRLLDGRYCEIKMLFYVGKDVHRWVEQCLELVDRDQELRSLGLGEHSFLRLLIRDTPANIREKLRAWGVSDYQAIFTRAAGLNAAFQEPPNRNQLATDFIRNYYKYADELFSCSQQMNPSPDVSPGAFDFELYASGEYTRMLEREWEAN